MTVTNNKGIVFDRIREEKTFFQRFMGLMGVKHLEKGEGAWFENCSSIHCFFMKIPIDVVYLDKTYRIVGIETVAPWRLGHIFRGARHTLELGAGEAAGLCVGDVLQIIR